MTQHVRIYTSFRDIADDIGAIEVSEAAISLVRSRLLHPIRPELLVSATDQARRRIEVCHSFLHRLMRAKD